MERLELRCVDVGWVDDGGEEQLVAALFSHLFTLGTGRH